MASRVPLIRTATIATGPTGRKRIEGSPTGKSQREGCGSLACWRSAEGGARLVVRQAGTGRRGPGTPRSVWSPGRARSPGPPRSAGARRPTRRAAGRSTGVSGRICSSLGLLPGGQPGGDLVAGAGVPAPGLLFDLLVQRPVEDLGAFDAWCRRRRRGGTRRRRPRPGCRWCAPGVDGPAAGCRRPPRRRRRPRRGPGRCRRATRCWR